MAYVCVSEGKKCSFFGKFGVLCFLKTPVLRFALLPYYRRLFQYSFNSPQVKRNLMSCTLNGDIGPSFPSIFAAGGALVLTQEKKRVFFIPQHFRRQGSLSAHTRKKNFFFAIAIKYYEKSRYQRFLQLSDIAWFSTQSHIFLAGLQDSKERYCTSL